MFWRIFSGFLIFCIFTEARALPCADFYLSNLKLGVPKLRELTRDQLGSSKIAWAQEELRTLARQLRAKRPKDLEAVLEILSGLEDTALWSQERFAPIRVWILAAFAENVAARLEAVIPAAFDYRVQLGRQATYPKGDRLFFLTAARALSGGLDPMVLERNLEPPKGLDLSEYFQITAPGLALILRERIRFQTVAASQSHLYGNENVPFEVRIEMLKLYSLAIYADYGDAQLALAYGVKLFVKKGQYSGFGVEDLQAPTRQAWQAFVEAIDQTNNTLLAD